MQARLTASRKKRRPSAVTDALVFDHISAAKRPVRAYEVVKATGLAGDPLLPVQVYRSLDRLQDCGRIKRVVALNAFVAAKDESPMHMFCTNCGTVSVVSTPEIHLQLEGICEDKGFAFGEPHLELFGHCDRCEE